MKHNLRPGPKVPGRLAKTGEYCPPGSEGASVYRGIRPFRKVCKYGGHPKFHPGRCVECRRLSDKKREMSAERAEKKRRNYAAWEARPGSKERRAAQARRRNARQEQKDANALRQRKYRSGHRNELKRDPKAIAARLLAKAEAKAKQAAYGILGELKPRGF